VSDHPNPAAANRDPDPDPTEPRLPELTEGVLDEPTLERLFEDLAACTEVLGILVKTAEHDRAAGAASPSLAEAREALRRRTVRGVQIRYRYQGAEWCDTLLAAPAGVRIVRVRLPR